MSPYKSAPISELDGITPEEAQKLRNVGINTITELWASIGRDPDKGLDQLAKEVDLEPHRLMDLMSARAIVEADKGERSWLRKPSSWLRGLRLFLAHHTLDIIAILGLAILVMLVLRAVRGLG